MQNKMKTQTITMIGLFTALLAVLSIIQIPMPSGVPITLQTFAMALCGYVLGAKKGALSVILYVIIGCIGVPVFAGMTGGLSVLFGVTGGFLYGFILIAFCSGLGKNKSQKWISVLLGLAGLLLCYAFGAIQFNIITGTGLWKSVLLVCVPYTVKDVISVIGAYIVSLGILKALKSANLEQPSTL